MAYVSFVEIFVGKGVGAFGDSGYSDAESRRYGTLCFFGGMMVIWALDKVGEQRRIFRHSSS